MLSFTIVYPHLPSDKISFSEVFTYFSVVQYISRKCLTSDFQMHVTLLFLNKIR